MAILSGGQTDFFGLDIGTLGLRAVQLRGAGPVKNLMHYGEVALDVPQVNADNSFDKQLFGQAVHQLLRQAGLTTKNVAVNIPSNRVFTAVVDVPKLAPAELEKTIRYQADSFIPTPLMRSKIDWVVIGDSPQAGKVEVLLSSVPNNYIETRLRLVESAGLNVVAMEPDNIALARAITAPNAANAQLVIDIGSTTTDLVITIDGMPHLARSIPTGSQNIVRAASQNLGVDTAQAQQFVLKFGLGRDKLEAKVYNAIINIIDSLVGEIEKSIKFFSVRYGGTKLERIIVTGGASVLPELPLYIANKFGLNVEIGNAWRNINVPAERQNEVMTVSNHFAVAAGLAERET